MKKVIPVLMLVFSASMLKAQDVIILKSGETINGKVTEVGISELKYYKAANLQGPVYVVGKVDVAQVQYQNKTVDVFTSTIPYYNGSSTAVNNTYSQQPNVIVVQQPVPPKVVVQRPYYGVNPWPYVIAHGLFDTHISFGGGHHGYYGGHHWGHH